MREIGTWKIILKKLHLSSTMKFVVFIIALAMQCVSTKSYNGYDARKACCALIDLVANGLKYALTETETEYEKIKAEEQDEDKDKEPKVQELYRKVCEKNTKNHGQRHINKIDIGDSNYKSISKCEKRKSYTKHNTEEKHEGHPRRNHHHHQNATIKDISSKSGATISTYSDSLRQMEIIDEKYEKKNVITLHDTSPKKITIRNISGNRMNDSIDLQQEKFIRNHKDAAENTEIESSSSQKEDPSMIPEIINIEYKPICEDSDYQDCNYNSDHLSITKKKHDKVADDCQHQSRKNCTTRIIDGQIADSRYDRTKPVMLRIVNWFFGGCPEASRRDQEQIDEVGKEEIFKSTNT